MTSYPPTAYTGRKCDEPHECRNCRDKIQKNHKCYTHPDLPDHFCSYECIRLFLARKHATHFSDLLKTTREMLLQIVDEIVHNEIDRPDLARRLHGITTMNKTDNLLRPLDPWK